MEHETVGERIRSRREELRLTQKVVADAVGTDPMQVSRWETQSIVPDSRFIVPLADVLRVTTDYILRSPGDLPRGLAELVASAEALGMALTEEEVSWCRSEVRSHGDVSVGEWSQRLRVKRRGLTTEQAAREDEATGAAAKRGEALGVPRRRRKRS